MNKSEIMEMKKAGQDRGGDRTESFAETGMRLLSFLGMAQM